MKKGMQDEAAKVTYEFYETRGRTLKDWVEAQRMAMAEHEENSQGMGHGEVGSTKKVKKGFRKTDKKGGRVYRD